MIWFRLRLLRPPLSLVSVNLKATRWSAASECESDLSIEWSRSCLTADSDMFSAGLHTLKAEVSGEPLGSLSQSNLEPGRCASAVDAAVSSAVSEAVQASKGPWFWFNCDPQSRSFALWINILGEEGNCSPGSDGFPVAALLKLPGLSTLIAVSEVRSFRMYFLTGTYYGYVYCLYRRRMF
jgi:hypothetical protein